MACWRVIGWTGCLARCACCGCALRPSRPSHAGRLQSGAAGGSSAGKGKKAGMKITGLKTFVVATGPRGGNWVFVKVYTDQDGLYGVGEGTVTSKAQTIVAAIEEHERFLIGKDPMAIE